MWNSWKYWTSALCLIGMVGCGGVSEQWSVFEEGMALADAEKRTTDQPQAYSAQAPAEMADKTVEKATELIKMCCEKIGGTWSEDASCGFAEEDVNQEAALATCVDESGDTAPQAG